MNWEAWIVAWPRSGVWMKSCGRKWLGGRPILSSVPSSRRARGTRRVGMSDIVDIDGIRTLEDMSREELLEILLDDAKNWLAHDGLWFQAVEAEQGMEDAIRADTEAWGGFTVVEAKRIMKRLGMEAGGGVEALVECLSCLLYTSPSPR